MAEDQTKPAKEPVEKPVRNLWVGRKAARDGTTYNELQKIIHANPGKTEDELKALIPNLWSAPNSEKYKKNPGAFLQGYFSAGVRKGFFVDNAEKANTVVPELVAGSNDGEKKEVKLTRAGRELIETIIKADSFAGEDGFVDREKVDELLGRPMTQLGKGVLKLVSDGLIEQGERPEGDAKKATVRVTDAGRELFAKGDAEPATETPVAEATQDAPIVEDVAPESIEGMGDIAEAEEA